MSGKKSHLRLDLSLQVDDIDLKVLGSGKSDGNNDDRNNVMNDSPPRIGPLDRIVVLNGLGHGQAPLQGQDNCSKNRRDNGHGLQLVQKVGESVDVGDLV